jgi:RNA polymerase sigma-70 factor (ECF subfamily)
LSQDVTADTFFKAFENIESFECNDTGSFSAWLYRIANNTFIDHVKTKNIEILSESSLSNAVDLDVVDLFEKKEQTSQIIAYLDTLGSDKKDIFLLRIWDQMNYQEISEILGKTPESCRQEFSRTLKKVVEKFSDSY